MSAYRASQQAPTEYTGVGGWLMFFCIVLVIISPLLTLINITNGFIAASRVADRLSGFMTAATIDSILAIIIMALSIFAGISLWSVRPNAVRIAKAYLIVVLVYAVIEVPLYMSALPSAASDRFMTKGMIIVLRTIAYVALWYSYLSKSKR